MRVLRYACLGVLVAIATACTTVAPAATQPTSVPVPGSGALPSASVPAPTTAPGESPAASTTPIETPQASVPASSEPATPEPTRTPRPSKSPKPTPTPIAIDLSIYVNTPDLPTEWHTNTDYLIPIHVDVAEAPIPSAHASVTVPEEAFSTSFDTGPIAPGDTYAYTVTVNLSAIGPATLTLQVKVPPGYTDINKPNNKVAIAITVLP